ncbi:hypothetical protein O181_054157 [Austropuccinia psidii MF-1]|uniref:Uncharacterized protein n=1 Tax=Austropuccinia psidii MF-1 TaxID=1389203 RepID=A0A9Q3EB48_9BASI|nr:hypothetical protein [Austropuccinia psidii MF-1]
MESLQPIEAFNLHESGTIQFKSGIDEIKPSIEATALLVPCEKFSLITDPDKYDYSAGLKLEPPPLARLNDLDTLIRFAQKHAKSHGYALIKENSHQEKNLYLEFDQYGEYILLQGSTHRKSILTKCRFKFRLIGSIPSPISLEILHNNSPSTSP